MLNTVHKNKRNVSRDYKVITFCVRISKCSLLMVNKDKYGLIKYYEYYNTL